MAETAATNVQELQADCHSVRELVQTCSDSSNSTALKNRATGEKGPETESNLGPTLYHEVLATLTTDPGQDPSSPIAF